MTRRDVVARRQRASFLKLSCALTMALPALAAGLAVREQAAQSPVMAIGLPSTVIYPDLFASLHRPGGSMTGFSPFGEDLAAKRVELLREAVPDATTVAILHNTVDPLYRSWGEKTEEAARQIGMATMAEQRLFVEQGRAHVVWRQPARAVSPRRHLRRLDSERRQPGICHA